MARAEQISFHGSKLGRMHWRKWGRSIRAISPASSQAPITPTHEARCSKGLSVERQRAEACIAEGPTWIWQNALNGIASQNYSNYYNRLAGLAGDGQSASNSLAGLGQNYANAAGNNIWNASNARSSAYQQSANANSQLAAGIGGIANNWRRDTLRAGAITIC